jgi:hypothetical protein
MSNLTVKIGVAALSALATAIMLFAILVGVKRGLFRTDTTPSFTPEGEKITVPLR